MRKAKQREPRLPAQVISRVRGLALDFPDFTSLLFCLAAGMELAVQALSSMSDLKTNTPANVHIEPQGGTSCAVPSP